MGQVTNPSVKPEPTNPSYCPVLNRPLYDAVTLKPCGHNISEEAVEGFYKSGRKICPLDNQAITGYQPNKALRSAPQVNYQALAYFSNCGLSMYHAGRYGEAIEHYNQVIRRDPNNGMVYFNCGLARSYARQYKEAIDDYNEALKKLDPQRPDYLQIFHRIASANFALGRYQEAILNCNEYIDRNNQNPEVFRLRAAAYNQMGQYDAAIQDYNEALKKLDPQRPDYVQIFHHIASANFALGRYQEAVFSCNRYIARNNQNPEVFCLCAAAHSNIGQYDEAIKNFGEAINIYSATPNSQDSLATAYRDRAEANFALAEYSDALKDCEKALKENSKSEHTWNIKGYVLLAKKQYKDAEICYDQALSINNKSSFSLQGRALSAYYQNDKKTAENYFTQADDFASQRNISYQCDLYFFKALIHVSFGENSEAHIALDKVRRLNKNYLAASKAKEKLFANQRSSAHLELVPRQEQKTDTAPTQSSKEESPAVSREEMEAFKAFVAKHEALRNADSLDVVQKWAIAQERLRADLKDNQDQLDKLTNLKKELEGQNINPQQLEQIKEQLIKLEAMRKVLSKECEMKAAQQAAEKAFQSHPNLISFYRTCWIHLEQTFMGCKTVGSGLVSTDHKGKLGKVGTAVDLLGKIASSVPFVGNVIGTVFAATGTVLNKVDNKRQGNILSNIGNKFILADYQTISEKIARELTIRYSKQLKMIPIRENNNLKSPSSLREKVINQGNDIIKKSSLSQVEEVAQRGVLLILSALLDDVIDLDKPWESQCLEAVAMPLARAGEVKQVIMNKMGKNVIRINEKIVLDLLDFFAKPGILTPEGKYFEGDQSNTKLYGFRMGTEEEAKKLDFREIPPPNESLSNPPTPTNSSPKTPPPIPAKPKMKSHSMPLLPKSRPIPPPKPPNLAYEIYQTGTVPKYIKK